MHHLGGSISTHINDLSLISGSWNRKRQLFQWLRGLWLRRSRRSSFATTCPFGNYQQPALAHRDVLPDCFPRSSSFLRLSNRNHKGGTGPRRVDHGCLHAYYFIGNLTIVVSSDETNAHGHLLRTFWYSLRSPARVTAEAAGIISFWT